MVRALLVAIAVLVGYQITRDYDPYWVAIVVLVVFLPDTDKATFKAFQRGTGTLAGALAGTALLAVTTSEPVILVAMLVAAFFTVVFYSANYTIYAFFLTAVIVFYEWFATGEQVGAGGQRLLAAVIGVALAIVGIGLMTRLRAAQTHPLLERRIKAASACWVASGNSVIASRTYDAASAPSRLTAHELKRATKRYPED